MCPICFSTTALLVAGTTGGLAVLTVTRLRAKTTAREPSRLDARAGMGDVEASVPLEAPSREE